MDKAKYYDYIAEELFNNHSLAALVVSIGAGRELDFRYKDVPYSITLIDNKVKLENAKNGDKKIFLDVEDLIINGKVDTFNIIEVWDQIVLDFLY